MYASEEFQSRYTIFKGHMDFVQAWNADKTHTHTVELNQFADISNADYQRIYLGTRFDGTARLQNAGVFQTGNVNADIVNWVNKGAVTAIKNQGQCGSCWAFSTTGSTEGIHQIRTGSLVSLSEQNLMDCSTAYGNEGCNGGLMDNAFRYIIGNNGIDLESYYPYTAAQGTCKYSTSWLGAQISSFADVQSGNEAALAASVNTQPVSVAIDASHESFQLYKSGIYSDPACSSTALDHGVLAVGYGTSTADYWLVKNSWGTDWGMDGYIQMARNDNNMCGIATMASFPLA
jgi:cathepsin L